MSLGYSVYYVMHVFVALADVHIIADTDNVSHEGNHVSGLTNGLTMSDLALALVKILNLKTKQVTSRCKRETGTGRVITEQGDAQAGLEYLGGDVMLSHVTQSVSYGENSLDLIIGLLPGQEEIALVHIFEVQFVQFVNVTL